MKWDALVAKLYGLRRFGIDPGLGPMQVALKAEGHPDRCYGVITVAGTNGKGTVASMVAAILQAHGLRVGLYTSPHLIDVTERLRVDGVPLSRREVGPVLERLLEQHGRSEDESGAVTGLTFFELTTLAAAVLFNQKRVDVAVFEVGLGGRLDAVNALDPVVTAVTTIGFDHTQHLGTEIGDIAREKAGIFREDIPAVIGAQEVVGARDALVEAAKAVGTPVDEVSDGGENVSDESGKIQTRHRRTAMGVARRYLGDRWRRDAVDTGLACWRWPGRFDQVSLDDGARRLLLDAAHNPAGVAALRKAWSHRADEVSAVLWTAMKDKDPGQTKDFLSEVGAPVWGAMVENERVRSEVELRNHVPPALWQGARPTAEAFEEAMSSSKGTILAFGSIFLLGEVLEACGMRAWELRTYDAD